MGKTIIEKIFQKHSSDDVKPGNIVWIDLDVRSARDFGGANVVKNFEREYPGDKVNDPAKTFFTFDCVVPANTIPYANNQQICRDFAKQQNIRVFDVDTGIGTHVMIENGLALPGSTIVGTDSHLNLLGAVGSFGQGMGDQDIAFACKAGKTWFEVPETIKIVIKGNYEYPLTARDVTLEVVGSLGSKGALGKAVEYYGEAVEKMDLPSRITLASMSTEMGAIAAIIPPNDPVEEYLKERSGLLELDIVYADGDAEYSKTVEVDLSGMTGRISKPYKPDNVVAVSEVAGTPVGSIFVGSCTNGRFEDFAAVAEILKGKRIPENVMFKAVPATKEVYKKMLESGVLQTLFEAGVIVSHAGCGGCASGQIGMTGRGEVQISTSNRNFAGKQGHGDTYLASPVVAAISALNGKITDPQEVL